MKRVYLVAATLAATVGVASTAFAGPVGIQRAPAEQDQVIAALEATRAQVARERTIPAAKGALQVRYMEKQAALDDVIDRLRSGQEVSPGEIERALQK